MDHTRAFRMQLAQRLFSLMAIAVPAVAILDTGACGGDTQTGQGGASSQASTSSGPTTSGGSTGTRCFAWPQAGTGGAGGTGGTASSTGGSAGMGGMGGAGGAETPACPSSMDAINYLMLTCGGNVMTEGTFDGTQCCYTVYENSCVTGRPYLSSGQPVLSEVLHLVPGSTSWSERSGTAPELPEPSLRAFLAKAWTRDALGEHASIASFGRFALELMALGAPAALVEAAHQAALDEIQHARLCFALASAYAGEDLGPSAFPFEQGRMEISTDLADLAVRTVREGCVGETLAAVQAAEQLASASDPAVKAALSRIAEDESRHAELAYKTVVWALQAGGKRVRDAVAQVLVEICGQEAGSAPPAEESGWTEAMPAHGRLSPAMVQESAGRTLREVVRPALSALLRNDAPKAMGAEAATL